MTAAGSPSAKPPGDADTVIEAFRLGWALAELRGRYRPGFTPVRGQPPGKRSDHALPLADERSPAEQLIELHGTLAELAKAVKVNDGGPAEAGKDDRTWCGSFDGLAEGLRKQPTEAGWEALADFAFRWDAHIQDTLVLDAPSAAAYQLGRGLAETYWALDPNVGPEDWRSWEFLLGDRRRQTLGRLVSRLANYVDPLAVPAVTEALDAWSLVVADPALRKAPDTLPALYDQGLLWRDLIRGERRPEDLVAQTQKEKRERGPIKQLNIMLLVLHALWPQILVALGWTVLLAVCGAELAAGSSPKTFTFLGVLSGLGVTSTAAYTRAKGVGTALLGRVRAAYMRDAVGFAASLAPIPKRTLTLSNRNEPRIDSASPRMTQLPG